MIGSTRIRNGFRSRNLVIIGAINSKNPVVEYDVIKLVYRKDFDGLRQAVAQEANLNAVDKDGRTPLMHAVLATDADSAMVRFLVANGANPKSCIWELIHDPLREQVRRKAGKQPSPTAAIMDSQSVKIEDQAGERGYGLFPQAAPIRYLIGCKGERERVYYFAQQSDYMQVHWSPFCSVFDG